MKVLFVCTGNLCRSPLAEALAVSRGVEARSAGTAALEGEPATPEARAVAAERGLDLSAHRARLLAPEHVDWADAVLVMGESHRRRVEELGGGAKVTLLDEADVADPYGLGLADYRRCLETIERALERRL